MPDRQGVAAEAHAQRLSPLAVSGLDLTRAAMALRSGSVLRCAGPAGMRNASGHGPRGVEGTTKLSLAYGDTLHSDMQVPLCNVSNPLTPTWLPGTPQTPNGCTPRRTGTSPPRS